MGGKGRGQACGTWNKHAGPAAVCGLPKSASPGHLRLNSQQMCQDSATRFSLRVLGILLWKPQPCAENSPHCFLSPEVRNGCYIKVMGLSSQLPLFPLISCWTPRTVHLLQAMLSEQCRGGPAGAWLSPCTPKGKTSRAWGAGKAGGATGAQACC